MDVCCSAAYSKAAGLAQELCSAWEAAMVESVESAWYGKVADGR